MQTEGKFCRPSYFRFPFPFFRVLVYLTYHTVSPSPVPACCCCSRRRRWLISTRTPTTPFWRRRSRTTRMPSLLRPSWSTVLRLAMLSMVRCTPAVAPSQDVMAQGREDACCAWFAGASDWAVASVEDAIRLRIRFPNRERKSTLVSTSVVPDDVGGRAPPAAAFSPGAGCDR